MSEDDFNKLLKEYDKRGMAGFTRNFEKILKTQLVLK